MRVRRDHRELEESKGVGGILKVWKDHKCFQESWVKSSQDPRGSEGSNAFGGIPGDWKDFLGLPGSHALRFGWISWFGQIHCA